MTLEVVLGSIRSDAPSRISAPISKELAARERAVRILVVDDEPSICKALSAALTRAGYDVATAQSGEAALATVRAEHIDVLLLDLRIPDMRGDIIFEVAAATQPQLAYQTVFMTGDITEKAASLIAACRCVMLRKPFDLTELFDAIAAIAPNLDRDKDQTA
jgi:DNA-binding NtrC family response regulator